MIVRVYSNQGWVTLAWTVAGGLSTISHGFFLIVTAPAWAAVGGTVTAIEFSKGKVRAVPREGLRLHEFARFPAGMPPGWRDAPRPPPPEPMVPDWAPGR